MKQFAITIREARKQKGLSQKQLAKKIQCPPTTLAGWEQGKFVPNERFRHCLAEVLEVSIEQLIDTRENTEDTLKTMVLEQAKQISSFEEVDETIESEQLSDLIKGYWILNDKERFQLIEMMKVLISSRKFND